MLARTPSAEIEETPASIAAGVRKPGRHQLLERELTGLRERRAAARAEILTLNSARTTANEDATDGKVSALSVEIGTLEDQIRQARREVAPLRSEHALAVSRALEPTRTGAAVHVLQALAILRENVRLLDEVADEISRAGGDAARMPFVPQLGEIENAARRIAGDNRS